jgi:hypothetical protein
VPAVAEDLGVEPERAWGPIGALSGLAERLGGAVSESIGIDVEKAPGGNGSGPAASPVPADPEERQ